MRVCSSSSIETQAVRTLIKYWFEPGLGTGRSVSYLSDDGPPGVALLVNEEGRWRACMYLGTLVCSLIVLDVIFNTVSGLWFSVW